MSMVCQASLQALHSTEVVIKPLNIPEGCRFKGYQIFAIQDISLTAKEIIYRLEVWQYPNGDILRAWLRDALRAAFWIYKVKMEENFEMACKA